MKTQGVLQVVKQVVNRLAEATESFTRPGNTILTLPELEAAKRNGRGFRVLFRPLIVEKAPRLRTALFTLTFDESEGKVSFSLGSSS